MLVEKVFEDGTTKVVEVKDLAQAQKGEGKFKAYKKVAFVRILDTVTKAILAVVGLLGVLKKK